MEPVSNSIPTANSTETVIPVDKRVFSLHGWLGGCGFVSRVSVDVGLRHDEATPIRLTLSRRGGSTGAIRVGEQHHELLYI